MVLKIGTNVKIIFFKKCCIISLSIKLGKCSVIRIRFIHKINTSSKWFYFFSSLLNLSFQPSMHKFQNNFDNLTITSHMSHGKILGYLVLILKCILYDANLLALTSSKFYQFLQHLKLILIIRFQQILAICSSL